MTQPVLHVPKVPVTCPKCSRALLVFDVEGHYAAIPTHDCIQDVLGEPDEEHGWNPTLFSQAS